MLRLASILSIILCLALVPACKKKDQPPPTAQMGTAAPVFTLHDTDGNTVTLSDYLGKVIVVEFFATWCPPCKQAAPELNALYERLKDRDDFAFLALSIDEYSDLDEAKRELSEYKKTYGIEYPVLWDSEGINFSYNVLSIPTSYIIDKNGKLYTSHMGFFPELIKLLEDEIEELR